MCLIVALFIGKHGVINNSIMVCFGKGYNVCGFNATFPLAYTGIPSVCGCHVYTGGDAYSPVILDNSKLTTTSFHSWFTNNERGNLLWISIGY